jgi:hypothetical protein
MENDKLRARIRTLEEEMGVCIDSYKTKINGMMG